MCTDRYTNSNAAIAHLDMFADKFGDRLAKCAQRQHIAIYGNPSPELRDKLEATQPVGGDTVPQAVTQGIVGGGQNFFGWVGGFSRL